MKKINKRNIVEFLASRGFLRFLSDKAYLKFMFKVKLNRKLNLDNPQTFNEKLQWLKLYDRKPEYSIMVDKYEAKKYVAERIGEEYIIPTLGVWDKFEDIDFDSLPNQFVLKCTHDSGGLVIVRDKTQLDIKAARKKINKSLRHNYYFHGREWPYKNVKPRIIAEKYMTDNGQDLADYKILNFNGEPKIILVCRDRYKDSGLTEDFYSNKWEHLDIKRLDHSFAKEEQARPIELDQMLYLSKELSKSIPFVRTDFYLINHKVFWGELTFYPASGLKAFEPEEYDKLLGEWIRLPKDVK